VIEVVAAEVLQQLPEDGRDDDARQQLAPTDIGRRQQAEGRHEDDEVEDERDEDARDHG